MHALAQMLKYAGIDVINLDRDLHDYQYNGFEQDFSKYSRKEDVLRDSIAVVNDTRKVIHEYFQIFTFHLSIFIIINNNERIPLFPLSRYYPPH